MVLAWSLGHFNVFNVAHIENMGVATLKTTLKHWSGLGTRLQWCSTVQLLPVCKIPTFIRDQFCSLLINCEYHGQCKQALAYQVPNWYVTEAFSLYSDIARCRSPTPRSCTDSEEKGTILPEPCSGVGYVHVPILLILNKHTVTVRHARESCM